MVVADLSNDRDRNQNFAYIVQIRDERRNLEVAEMILQKLNKPRSLISFVTDRLGHDWRYAVDSTLISSLGWRPSRMFEDGLDQTIEWYQSHE